MKRFSPDAACVKCGSYTRDMIWKERSVQAALRGGAGVSSPECLIVKCRLCGYRDVFEPMDAPLPS